MLLAFSLDNSTTYVPTDVSVGTLLADFTYVNKNKACLLTKAISSDLIKVGNSLRKLTDFPEYLYGVESSSNSFSFLSFTVKQDKLKLTTTLPFLLLGNLGGTTLSNSVEDYTNKPYISIGSDLKLTNAFKPSIGVHELGDVHPITLTSTVNNYALLSRQVNDTNPGKDPFTTSYSYLWQLAPELTKLIEASDVDKQALAPNQVLRAKTPLENRGEELQNVGFSISYDVTPELQTSLNCAGFSIRNVNYRAKKIVSTGNVFTVVCDTSQYTTFIVENVDSVGLFIDISVDRTGINRYVPICIIIKKFSGYLRFNQEVEYENGVPPVLTGDNHILNALIVITANSVRIRIVQKATNISKVK